jgi:glycosyltransferase involved in cell wall biosynthesis
VIEAGGLWAVVPAFNEAPTLAGVVGGLRRYCPVVVVDDGSTDRSAAVARAAGATDVVCHASRRGKGAALRSGFAAALRRGASAVATVDGDGQHDPDDLPRLARAAREAPDALVVGDRLAAASGDAIPLARRCAIRAANRAIGALVPVQLSDSQSGFRIYPAAFLRVARLREEGFVLETEALVQASRAGFPIVSVPVRRVYPPGRRSRFHAVGDVARIAGYLARAWLAPPAPRRVAPMTVGVPAAGKSGS